MNIDRLRSAVTLCVLLTAGCGQEAPVEEDATTPRTAVEQAAPAQPQPDENPTTAALSLEDLERRERGMAAEEKAVLDAAAKLETAKNEDEELEAMMAATEMRTIESGAGAAGVSVDRYRYIRDTVSSAAAKLVPIEQTMDVSGMPKEMLDQMKTAREEGIAALASKIPSEVLGEVRARASEIRKQDLALAGKRLEVATEAR